MKIIKLTSQNIKNLRAVEITPDGNVVRITGANEAGKSSVLDSVFCTLTGTRMDDPIRHGQDRAEVVVDMGDFIVKRTWTQKGERLEVTNKDGDKKSSPQAFLDGIIGKLSFDPLEFQNMKPKDQRELLRTLVGLDFTDIDTEYKKTYDERTEVNVGIKGAIAQLQAAEAPHPATPNEEISFKEQLDSVQQLRDKRASYVAKISLSEQQERIIAEEEENIKYYEEKIKEIQDQIKNSNVNIMNARTEIESIVLPPEVTESEIIAAETSLQDIEEKNVKIRKAMRYRTLAKDAEKLKEKADSFTQRLERLDQDKATRIANAEMPVTGLSMSDDAVIFDGIPFSQLSTGRKIRVSTAIAMKLNPMVRVIFVRDGSLLDENAKQEIFKMAKENDYQVWMEETRDDSNVGFYIETGEIKKIDGEDINNENPN